MTNTVNPCHTFDTFRNSFINNLYGNYSQTESSHSKRIFLIIAMIKIRLVDIYQESGNSRGLYFLFINKLTKGYFSS